METELSIVEEPALPGSSELHQTDSLVTAEMPDNLPPMDRGWQAWKFCISASMLETLIWGYGFSFGVFQDWYTSNPPFQSQSPVAVSAIGASALGIQYFEGLGLMALLQTRPQWMRIIMWTCLVVCTLCLLFSSFATKVTSFVRELLMAGMAVDPCSGRYLRHGSRDALFSYSFLGLYFWRFN